MPSKLGFGPQSHRSLHSFHCYPSPSGRLGGQGPRDPRPRAGSGRAPIQPLGLRAHPSRSSQGSRLPATTALRIHPAEIINAGCERRSSSPFDSGSVCHVARPPHLKPSSLSTLYMRVQPTEKPWRKAVRERILSASPLYINNNQNTTAALSSWPCATCLTPYNPHGNTSRVAFTVNPILQLRKQRCVEVLAKSDMEESLD